VSQLQWDTDEQDESRSGKHTSVLKVASQKPLDVCITLWYHRESEQRLAPLSKNSWGICSPLSPSSELGSVVSDHIKKAIQDAALQKE